MESLKIVKLIINLLFSYLVTIKNGDSLSFHYTRQSPIILKQTGA